jgi:hypothetical protein
VGEPDNEITVSTPHVRIHLVEGARRSVLMFDNEVSERLARQLVLVACGFATQRIELVVHSDIAEVRSMLSAFIEDELWKATRR